MVDLDAPKFRTRMAKDILAGLVRRGGNVNAGACGVVTDEKHAEFGSTVCNVWFSRDPKYPQHYDGHANFRLTEAKNDFVRLEGSFRLHGTYGDGQVTRNFPLPSGRSREGRYAWGGVEAYLALFRRIGQNRDHSIISKDVLDQALTILWWGADQSMKNTTWSPGDFEPLRKAWAEVAPLWTPPRPDDELPDYVRNTLDIPWPEEEETMPRPSRPTTSSITDTEEVKTERKIVVTMSAADMDAALIEWAKKNLNFNPPEGADIDVLIQGEGCDDHGTEGEPAYAKLTVDMVTEELRGLN